MENLICFIPFFMLNNRAVGSEYFQNIDFYLLYVLLFALVYGQQQATFSALLAVAGYCFRQMYHRSGFDVMLDYNTYVWIAQLLILGLAVGYLRDQLRAMREEQRHEVSYLTKQLDDISDINVSNVRVKEILANQIVNQNDSFGKLYEITSSLEQYEPCEVLFYAAEVLAKLMGSKDVAIYTVANRSYARLFSATSEKARSLGNSINYSEMDAMYTVLAGKKVYINKNMDERYPLMANAIYSEDEMQTDSDDLGNSVGADDVRTGEYADGYRLSDSECGGACKPLYFCLRAAALHKRNEYIRTGSLFSTCKGVFKCA